jgi:NitT/TauT family transport system substrate-binding protein
MLKKISAFYRKAGARCLAIVAVVVTAVFLVSCYSKPAQPLRLGSNLWPGYEPLYWAQESGDLKDIGVRLVELTSATEVLHAFRAGNLEMAALTLDEALTLAADGIDITVIWVMDISKGADALVFQPTLRRLELMKGARIGVENTAVGALMLHKALAKAGLTLRDIVPITLTVDEHESAFYNGAVDGVVTFEPTKSKLIEMGGHEVFSSRDIYGDIIDVLVIKTALVEQNQSRLYTLIRAFDKASRAIEQNSKGAISFVGKRMQISEGEVSDLYKLLELGTIEHNQALLSENGAMQRRIEQTLTLMNSANLVHQPQVDLPVVSWSNEL